MTGSASDSEPNEATEDRKPRRGSLLSLLAWAGVGFAASRALRRRPDDTAAEADPASDQRSRSTPGPSAQPEPTPAGSPRDASPLDLPADLDIAWVPGPGGGVRVAQRQTTAAMPVIYVHGLGGSIEQWAPGLNTSSDRVRPIAFDLPGHGGSDPLGTPSLDRLAASLGAVVGSLGARRVVLVGHSLGASIALRWAARHSDRVAGVLLVDPNGDQTRLPEAARALVLEAIAEDAHGELEGHYRQFLRTSSPEVADAILGQLRATAPEVLHDLLAASFAESPVDDLIAFRDAGGMVRAVLSALNDAPISLHRLVPELEVAWVEGAGHWLMLDAPDVFAELQGGFLADAVGGSSTTA